MIPIPATPQDLAQHVAKTVKSSCPCADLLGRHIASQHWLSAINHLLDPVRHQADETGRRRGMAFRLLCDFAAQQGRENPLYVALVASVLRWCPPVVHEEEWKTCILALIEANHRLSQESVNRLFVACSRTEITSGIEVLEVAGYRPSHDVALQLKAA